MKNRNVFFGLAALICLVLLAFSYMQWKNKIASHYSESSTTINDSNLSDKKTKKDKSKNDHQKAKKKESEDEFSLETLLANADESVKDVFQKRIEQDEAVNMLILGSNELEYGDPGVGERVENALKKHFDTNIETTVTTYEGDIANLMNYNLSEYVNFNNAYDVILLEPFTLRNNGVVGIDDEHEYINNLIGQFTSVVEDAVVVLHPTQPIYQADNYPLRVDALKQFANDNDYIYLDHWTEWTDYNEEAFQELVDGDNHPNNEGANIWATSIIDYFIADKMEE